MNKFKNYFKKIKEIKDINQIPTNIEISIILENFKKYLNDSRYYIKFFNKYKSFWSKESNKFIQNYKELYIPIEKRKDIFNLNQNQNINDFIPLRNKIFDQFYNQNYQIFDDSNLPELSLYYSKLSFVPSMNKNELNDLYFNSFISSSSSIDEDEEEDDEDNLDLEDINIEDEKSINNDKNVLNNEDEINLKEFIKRKHFTDFENDSTNFINYFENEIIKEIKIEDFINEIEKLKEIFKNERKINSIWILHGKNNFTYHYLLFICLSIELDIPCILFNSKDLKYLPKNLNNDLIVTCKVNFKKTDFDYELNNLIFYYGFEDSEFKNNNWDINLNSFFKFKNYKQESILKKIKK